MSKAGEWGKIYRCYECGHITSYWIDFDGCCPNCGEKPSYDSFIARQKHGRWEFRDPPPEPRLPEYKGKVAIKVWKRDATVIDLLDAQRQIIEAIDDTKWDVQLVDNAVLVTLLPKSKQTVGEAERSSWSLKRLAFWR